MSIGDPHQEEEEGQMAACASGRTADPGKGLQRVRKERCGQRIHDANLDDGAGLVDEEIGGHDNQPRPRRKILWAAIGAAAGLAAAVLPLAVLVMKMGKGNERIRKSERARVNEMIWANKIMHEKIATRLERILQKHEESAAARVTSREDVD